MQFTRLPSELLIGVNSYLPLTTIDSYLDLLSDKDSYDINYLLKFDIYRNILFKFYPFIVKYLKPFINNNLYDNLKSLDISLREIINEIENKGFRQLQKIEKSCIFYKRSKKDCDYEILMKLIDISSSTNSYNIFKLILNNPNIDINYVPTERGINGILNLPIINMITEDLNEDIIKIIISNPRIKIEEKNKLLISLSGYGSQYNEVAHILLNNWNYNINIKEQALSQNPEVYEYLHPKDISNENNIIIHLIEDLKVNPSIGDNTPLRNIMKYTFGPAILDPSSNLYLYPDERDDGIELIWKDIETLISRPLFDFTSGKEEVILQAYNSGYPNIIKLFKEHNM